MNHSKSNISPLRQRMIEDMTMRKLSTKTQSGYIRAVSHLSDFLKHSPANATAEELRQFRLYLIEQGTSAITLNATLTALRFLYTKTLNRPEVTWQLVSVPTPRKIPVILSREEVGRLLAATTSIKYRTAFSVAYGAGLRVSEVVALKVTDVDSERMLLRIEQAKGKKDRQAMLSPVLLNQLREWWHYANAQRLMLHGGWLFPGQDPVDHLSARQLSRACRAAADDAGLEKHVTMHTFRHSFATHLLESKVDIRVIQTLLGHQQLETTATYASVASSLLQEVVSPLDALTTH